LCIPYRLARSDAICSQFALFFNGEATCRAVGERKAGESKETVWALYNRLMLLWHSCLRTRVDNTLSYPDKAQFAMAAWLELDAIEEALDSHTCELERAFMFQGREVIFKYVERSALVDDRH
jgi:hypothetical protein